MNVFKAFTFQHGLKLKHFFLKLKAQVMKLICYMTENIKMRLMKTVKRQQLTQLLHWKGLIYLSMFIVPSQNTT